MHYKREVLLKIIWHIIESEMFMLPLKLAVSFLEGSFKNCSICEFILEIKLVEEKFSMRLQKRDFLFVIIF